MDLSRNSRVQHRSLALLLAGVVGLGFFFRDIPNLSSAAGTGHPYYSSARKLGLVFELANYDSEMDDPVWARPSLPTVLAHAKGQPLEPNVKLRLAQLYQRLGLAQASLGQYEELINEAKKGPAVAAGLAGLQSLLYEVGEYGRAVSTLDLVEKFEDPVDLDGARYLAGISFLKLGAPKEAVAALSKVPESSSKGPFARYSLGLAYSQLGEAQNAEKAFISAIQMGRKLVSPVRLKLQNRQTGETEVRIIPAALYPDERVTLEALVAKSQLALGYLYVQNKAHGRAVDVFSEIPEENPYYPDALYAKAWAEIYQNQLVQAIVTLNKLIKGVPAGRLSQEALLLIGSAYVNLGVYDKAISAYQTAVEFYEDERKFAHYVIEEGFLRNHFQEIRLYFDPASSISRIDPTEGMNDDEKQVFVRVVTNPEVREWFELHTEVGEHLRQLRAAGSDLSHQTNMIDQKLGTLGDFESRLDESFAKRIDRLQQQYELLDARINNRSKDADIWALATKKETERLQEYNRKLSQLRKMSRELKAWMSANESTMSGAELRATEEITHRIARDTKHLEILRGEMAWAILSNTEMTAGGLRRRGQGGASAVLTALYNKELSKLKGEINRAQEKLRAIQDNTVATRSRMRDLKRRSQEVTGKQAQLLSQSERYYLGLTEKVIDEVAAVYKRYDGRLERFVAEAEFGVIGALDRQSGQ
ncbi:MAG: tetratricopeptide repeat protein [Chrysiogenetes bacterium]|nr:tetratricopeptide repeat protein [Chrysiogenetes bacterium]